MPGTTTEPIILFLEKSGGTLSPQHPHPTTPHRHFWNHHRLQLQIFGRTPLDMFNEAWRDGACQLWAEDDGRGLLSTVQFAVSSKTSHASKGLATHAADEQLLCTVQFAVSSKTSHASKGLATHATDEQLLCTVQFAVSSKTSHASKGLATHATDEQFLPCVHRHVVLQRAVLTKGAVTQRAFMRFLTGVDTSMRCEAAWCREPTTSTTLQQTAAY